MIFVTIGNQNFQFKRFLEKIENLLKNNFINDEVIAQIGYTDFESDFMQTFDFLTKEKFNEYIEKSEYVISHSGTGSLISCLRNDKCVIAGARLKRLGEHIDNHQTEILEAFSREKYILKLNEEFSDLEEKIEQVKNFAPKKFVSNNNKFNEDLIRIIEDF